MDRITNIPEVLHGNASIRGMSVSAEMLWNLIQLGHTAKDLIKAYPYLELEDVLAVITWGEMNQLEEQAVVKASKAISRR